MSMAIILDGSLPPGVAANAAAVLAMSLGKKCPDWVGPDVRDGANSSHPGITAKPIPILSAEAVGLADLRQSALGHEGLEVVDFTQTAQKSRDYDQYTAAMAELKMEELIYLGIAVWGASAAVKSLTGSLPLYRGGK